MLTFGNGERFERFWFVGSPVKDLMGGLYKDTDGEWRLAYRFRYYTSGTADPFAEDDKSWVSMKIKPDVDPAEMLPLSNVGIDIMLASTRITWEGEGLPVEVHDYRADGDGLDMFAIFKAAEWAHMRPAVPSSKEVH